MERERGWRERMERERGERVERRERMESEVKQYIKNYI